MRASDRCGNLGLSAQAAIDVQGSAFQTSFGSSRPGGLGLALQEPRLPSVLPGLATLNAAGNDYHLLEARVIDDLGCWVVPIPPPTSLTPGQLTHAQIFANGGTTLRFVSSRGLTLISQ